MTFDFPKADWLPLAKAVFDVHQSDSWKDATSEELLNSLLFRVTVDFPDVEAELSDRSIIISRRGESGGQSWSEEIGTYTLGQPFEYHEYLQQTPPDEFRKQAETVIRTFLARLDQVFRKQHSRGRFSLYARVGSSTARTFTLIPPDVFAHFEITDWSKGAAIAGDGERLFSVHVGAIAGEQTESPELPFGDEPAHPRRQDRSRQFADWALANKVKRHGTTWDALRFAFLSSRGEEKTGKIDNKTMRKGFEMIEPDRDYGQGK